MYDMGFGQSHAEKIVDMGWKASEAGLIPQEAMDVD
jgi:hypothetical protein